MGFATCFSCKMMKMLWNAGVSFSFSLSATLCLLNWTAALDIPLEALGHTNIEQLPTITEQSPTSQVAFPFDEKFPIKCEAKGNPHPEFKWTKDGQPFDPSNDPRVTMVENSGTFIIGNSGNISEFQGVYRCSATNKLGTAISEEIEIIIPTIPKFPKEKNPPITVEEGNAVVLQCNPPKGIPPLKIHWMTISLQHIDQDERVSVGLNGDLYFSNVLEKDSRRDYCCFAAFPRIRTIVQKTPMTLIVNRIQSFNDTESSVTSGANSILQRRPKLLTPSGGHSTINIVKGNVLQLECIAEGLPTPKIEWTRLDGELPKRAAFPNQGKLLKISEVTEAENGLYQCNAANALGKVLHNFQVTVEEPPRWLSKPESMIYTIGADVTLDCKAAGKPEPTIQWKVNGVPLRNVPVSIDNQIVRRNVKKTDSAVYQCEASNKHGTILASANILVMNLPPMLLTDNNLEYAAVEGKDVLLDCKVFGSPHPVVEWDREDSASPVQGPKYFIYENGSLNIKNTIKEDSGLYTCLTGNTEGKAAITAILDIRDATQIVEPPENIKVLRGSTAQFTCGAKYDSASANDFQVSWNKDNEEITFIHTDNSRFYVEDGVLQIINVSSEDQGNYTCVASTALDQAQETAALIVLDVPDPPEDLKLSEPKNTSVRLNWTPGNSHNKPITEFIVEYEESRWKPGDWHELVRVAGNHTSALLKLHGHVDYQFRVSAVNEIGRSQPSDPSDRYKTLPRAPENNPGGIVMEGNLPNEIHIKWEPLKPIEQNGPGLEYKVSWRRKGVEDNWNEEIVKRHSFFIRNTPTFEPYEIQIQAINHLGFGPEPKVVTGFSGEDFPESAPQNVAVEIMNSTVIKVNWLRVPQENIRGHLGGYRVHWWKVRSLLEEKRGHSEKHSLTFPGDRNHGMVPGLKPFSEYSLIVMAFNGRGNGPASAPFTFKTPEGVPEHPALLRVASFNKDSITLLWVPPLEQNGILTGHMLQYQLINDTEELGNLHNITISDLTVTRWKVGGLEASSKYKFYMSACTRVGCGKPITEEGITTMEGGHTPDLSIPTTTLSPVANVSLSSIEPALLNISSSVSDTKANISWITGMAQKESEFYIAYMNNRKGNWKISEAVNISQNFHIIEGLDPGSEYTIRLMTKNWVDNTSIFEDVVETRGKAYAGIYDGISTQGWFIGVMCAVALLTLIMLIACFVQRNKGGKYSVKEKEDLHPDLESQGINEDTFCEYSDNDEKPLKGSLESLDGEMKAAESGDSLAGYADEEHDQFNEDGSFIGEYAAHRNKGPVGVNGNSKGLHPVTA
ncbi:neural cell adhesion molecule L1-like protein isoform X3 [Polyodon spathula]|uniref:neural cell adhesion molecule L1-like protein isoform X3 n=1 Tax=Polyodon spathula TaxID=7913 RepID=UPI001B7E4A36|nr:neural cell adhesion molecule L1-like protein isoform X3 [Polyodon spathula]